MFLCITVSSVSWRDVPACYGKWHTIYTRFKRWSENGLFWFLVYQLQKKKKVTVAISWVDSTTIGIHRHSSAAIVKGGSSPGTRS
ncbi:transposase [Legionella longbeachae]|nr:transposase [Legionella longbeachae]